MNCGLGSSKPDWKAYVLGELDAKARREAEAHAASCVACQDEAGSLRITLDAMATLRDEELPRRIAFVSDKVFEPKWWQMFLKPSFAGAAAIAVAILVHAFVQPGAIRQADPVAQVDAAAIEARVSAEVEKRVQQRLNAAVNAAVDSAVNTAVTKAVADAHKRNQENTAQMLAAAERRYGQSTELMTRQVTQLYAMNTGLGVR
ncbi:MAG: hypothetical protein ABL967_11975 [Bryobacteraceae bacterium]